MRHNTLGTKPKKDEMKEHYDEVHKQIWGDIYHPDKEQ